MSASAPRTAAVGVATPARPVTILVGALGGEGGGVLSNWLVAAGEASGFDVQATSVPGVAQRTGATTYYLEMAPRAGEGSGGEVPVRGLALLPTPGNVDLVVASELLEAGRAAQSGMITPERTTVIASTHRFYAIAEKAAMGDGRFDTGRIVQAVRVLARRAILGNIGAVAADAGSVVSSVLLGTIAASEAVPVSPEAMREAVSASGIAVEANLRGFEAGYEFGHRALAEDLAEEGAVRHGSGAPADAREIDSVAARRIEGLPGPLGDTVRIGYRRVCDYQSARYGQRYLERLETLTEAERRAGGESRGWSVGLAVARALAVWMTYEDVMRVAALKIAPSRMAQIREEVRAGDRQPLTITEFLKPGLEEWSALLPGAVFAPLARFIRGLGLEDKLSVGLHVKSTSVAGYLLLRALAALGRLRPCSARFGAEQARIERWLAAVQGALGRRDLDLAVELGELATLVRGYGDTRARGVDSFERLMGAVEVCLAAEVPAAAMHGLRKAALADPEGKGLESALAALGRESARSTEKAIGARPEAAVGGKR